MDTFDYFINIHVPFYARSYRNIHSYLFYGGKRAFYIIQKVQPIHNQIFLFFKKSIFRYK